MKYSEMIQQHFEQPKHVQQGNARLGITTCIEIGSVDIGAYLQLFLQVDVKLHIIEIKYKAYGCPAVIALGSWLSCWLLGKSLSEAAALKEPVINAALALAPHKRYLASLAVNKLTRLAR